jgi:release factor glutamine methyltransferase
MRIDVARHEASVILKQSGVAEARREASSLLVMAIGRDAAFLVAHPEYKLSDAEESTFRELVKRRSNREPLQYIRGHQEFYGLDFVVSPDVLIPRPETELLVEGVLEVLLGIAEPSICEVGIGSGCIAVSILHSLPGATAVGLDVSPSALDVARINAEKNGVESRLDLRESDVFEAINIDIFDVIVSNPPYVPAADLDSLQAEVRDFEPGVALTDGGDGFSIISKIVSESPHFLRREGFLFLEIGFNQATRVREMFDRNIWRSIDLLPDLQGIPRIVKARIGHTPLTPRNDRK